MNEKPRHDTVAPEPPQIATPPQDKTRNSEALSGFVAYCEQHPDERFWQAIRNWCCYPFVLVARKPPYEINESELDDTFYWEGAVRPQVAAPPQRYVLVAIGEGADCRIVNDLSQATLHEFMCCCGNWQNCNLEQVKDAIESLSDLNNWMLDEDSKPFCCSLAEYETGRMTVYRLNEQAVPAVRPPESAELLIGELRDDLIRLATHVDSRNHLLGMIPIRKFIEAALAKVMAREEKK